MVPFGVCVIVVPRHCCSQRHRSARQSRLAGGTTWLGLQPLPHPRPLQPPPRRCRPAASSPAASSSRRSAAASRPSRRGSWRRGASGGEGCSRCSRDLGKRGGSHDRGHHVGREVLEERLAAAEQSNRRMSRELRQRGYRAEQAAARPRTSSPPRRSPDPRYSPTGASRRVVARHGRRPGVVRCLSLRRRGSPVGVPPDAARARQDGQRSLPPPHR